MGERIDILIAWVGGTQAELADLLELSRSQVFNIRRKKSSTSVSKVGDIAALFGGVDAGVTLDWLVFGHGDEPDRDAVRVAWGRARDAAAGAEGAA